jgi:hypothetical protein
MVYGNKQILYANMVAAPEVAKHARKVKSGAMETI